MGSQATTLRHWILAAAVAGGLTQPAASQNMTPLSERVARLPDSAFHTWFSVMLGTEYGKGRDWEDFFGDVGPTEGCSSLEYEKNQIVERDLSKFKVAYVDAVANGMDPRVFTNVPDGLLRIQFDGRISRFQRDLHDFLIPRVAEFGNAGRSWVRSHGYLGRRLGYNASGVPYWRGQFAMTSLVCLFPHNADLLKGWK